ncbi:protein trapped in endoderm-1 isoform X2 [Calliphora vicina]|uniref:protein trapped in endoderm-1 isoform X2 n=1 Tax=Calliphora vicina TaxID=7373 RepID=UPI00325ABE13
MESQSIYPHSATLFAATCACLFIVVGILGNLVTMFALMRSPKIRCHATTAFVLSLCISDLLFCSFSLPLTAVRFFKELPAVLGIWGEMGLDEITFSCTILKKNGKSIKKTLFLIGFLLPCLVIIISYTCIYIKVLKQKKRMINHRQYVVSTKEHIFNTRKSREDNRLTLMMVTIFVCFLVCFLPLMLANVVDDERNTSYPWLHIIASIMAWASSVINPIIYAASNRNYRIAYFKVFSNLKFWGEPMSPMPSKSFQPSKNSKDFSAAIRSTPLFQTTKLNNIREGCDTYSI